MPLCKKCREKAKLQKQKKVDPIFCDRCGEPLFLSEGGDK